MSKEEEFQMLHNAKRFRSDWSNELVLEVEPGHTTRCIFLTMATDDQLNTNGSEYIFTISPDEARRLIEHLAFCITETEREATKEEEAFAKALQHIATKHRLPL